MAMDGSSSLRRLVEIDVEKAANHKSLYQLELGMCTDSLLLKEKKKCPATYYLLLEMLGEGTNSS